MFYRTYEAVLNMNINHLKGEKMNKKMYTQSPDYQKQYCRHNINLISLIKHSMNFTPRGFF